MAVTGIVGGIYKASGKVNFTTEAMTNTGDNLTYKITDVNKRYWDRTATFVVRKDGAVQSSGFIIEHAGGQVVFAASQGAGVITVTGVYMPVYQVAGGFNWKLDIESDLVEATTFGSNGWKEYIQTLNGFSGSFEKYWLTEERKNLIPPFSDSAWTLHVNAVATSSSLLTLTASGTSQDSKVSFPALPSQPYTLSGTVNANSKIFVYSYNASDVKTNILNGVSVTSSFTSLADTVKLEVVCSNSATASGTFTFSNLQIELGSSATTYAPRVVLEDEVTKDLALVLYVDGGANKLRYEGYGDIKKTGIETPVDGLIKQSIDFTGDGKIYYRAG
jgi:hypothetical protein